jgi:Secretion system C-terminal sorting domain
MKTFLLFATALLINLASFCQSGPELVFENPVLVSGTANVQGAVYRFSNVTTGVDAEVKLKKFSRNSIVMATIDNASLGWSKAFQPEFGLSGLVLPNQHWYIDFEMTFFRAGTNTKQKMDTVDLTALDVDGDGQSISEYVTYDQPSSILYSTLTFLTNSPVGVLGQVFECGEDDISSPLILCLHCGGDGIHSGDECDDCHGSGMKHLLCGHAYEGGIGNTVLGPVNNFAAIDTSATQVMATYQFLNKDKIKFRYGARSNSFSSNGAGVRLNSTWFREFSLAPMSTLPVKLTSFNAFLTNSNKVDLKWATATEMNVSHFTIERSLDGTNFSDAGMIFAYGNTTVKSEYAFADNISNIQSSVIYYRLRSEDIDGKTQFSEIRIIRNSKQTNNSIAIATYPNPVTNELRITIPTNWQNKKLVYEVITLNGQTIKRHEAANSSQTETMNVSSLSSGMYMIRVSCEGQTAQQKIVKH